MSRRSRLSVFALSLSTLAILVATLYPSGKAVPLGWTFYLATGDQAVAEVIQNLLLFMPLGASLKIAGIRPSHAIATGAALSFTVEFLQQWIPGRDPSTGDIICNTIGTALGVLVVVAAPIWLWAPPRRSAWQAMATAILAVVAWIGPARRSSRPIGSTGPRVAARGDREPAEHQRRHPRRRWHRP